MNQLDGLIVEQIRVGGAGHAKTMTQVMDCVGQRQGRQRPLTKQPLSESGKLGAIHQGAKLRLTDQQDIQERTGISLQVSQRTQLQEIIGGHVLRLIDDQNGTVVGAGVTQQVSAQAGGLLH